MDLRSESSGSGSHKTNKKESSNGRTEFFRRTVLEHESEDINTMADAFIKNFRRQLKLEKDASFKRFQDMINRSA